MPSCNCTACPKNLSSKLTTSPPRRMLRKPSTLSPFSIYFVTWNVVTKNPMEELEGLLGLDSEAITSNLPDMYAIGLQEINAKPQAVLLDSLFEGSWVKAFRNVLAKYNYVKIRAIRLQGLLLILFLRRQYLVYLQDVQTEYTRTGLGGVWGNKGAVTIRLNMCGCSICIVNSHLAAHDVELKQRVDDYNSIVDTQRFRNPETENIFFHDYIFWIGDLNFRLDVLTREEIVEGIEQQCYQKLLEYDQLHKVMQKGLAFSELTEGEITFAPTYKFIPGSDLYDKNRKPGWTDRILYKVNANVYEHVTLEARQLSYRSHEEYCQSDHKPVSSHFHITVFQGLPEKYAQFESIGFWFAGQEHTVTYLLPLAQEPSQWDWIGLYKVTEENIVEENLEQADFSSLEDYVTYVWASDRGTPLPDQSPLAPSSEEHRNIDEHPEQEQRSESSVRNTNEWEASPSCINLETTVNRSAPSTANNLHGNRFRRFSEQVISAIQKLSMKFHSTPKLKFTVTFPELLSPTPGRYCLLYLSSGINNVYGMSEPFEILTPPLAR